MQSHSNDIVNIPQGFWESLNILGVSSSEVIQKAKLPFSLTEVPLVLKRSQYLTVWKIFAELIGDASQAIIKLVSAYKISKYPPSFMAIYHSNNYRDALKNMVKYKNFCPPENLTFKEMGDECYIELDHFEDDMPLVLIGSTLASILEVGRRGSGLDIKATLLELKDPVDNIRSLELFFGCKVKPNSLYNRLTLKRSDLNHTFVSSNEEVLSILVPTLDSTLSEIYNNQPFTHHVKHILKSNLSIENIDIETVSKLMRTGSRTLQRKLNIEGTNFKQLLMQVRHEKSVDFLANTTLSIKEIAFLVGYTDQNSFYRAFRMWESDTPTNWRKRANHSLNVSFK